MSASPSVAEPSIDLAVVTVTWNTHQLVLDMLRSLREDLQRSSLSARIVVVDNASTDGTPDAIRAAFPDPAVQVIASDQNLGFAAGNNVALRELGFEREAAQCLPRAVFLLNPDTLVQPGAISALYNALYAIPRAGLVGARLSYDDGTFQHGAFRFPNLAQIVIDLFPVPARLYESALNGRYRRALYEGTEPFPVDHTLGATMMLRREVIQDIGLLDEQFYMYCEEVDWCMRIRQARWEIYTVPTARITHLEGRSARQIRPQSVANLWTSRLRLYQKHYNPAKLAAARLLVRIGMRLQIRKAHQDTNLTAEQRDSLTAAYRKVIALFGGSW
jgi:N-acetylglucosaminyl-diphospho-decaprenol L-rhamnosyltransferase